MVPCFLLVGFFSFVIYSLIVTPGGLRGRTSLTIGLPGEVMNCLRRVTIRVFRVTTMATPGRFLYELRGNYSRPFNFLRRNVSFFLQYNVVTSYRAQGKYLLVV